MQAAFDYAVEYVHDRSQFGQAVGTFQLMQGKSGFLLHFLENLFVGVPRVLAPLGSIAILSIFRALLASASCVMLNMRHSKDLHLTPCHRPSITILFSCTISKYHIYAITNQSICIQQPRLRICTPR
jgi:hypothetical protein